MHTPTEILKFPNMRKIIFLVPLLLILSCNKDEQSSKSDNGLPRSTAYENFAEILSKAVSAEPDLRQFLKSEAQKQFDKDYDVFYPWCKDKLVSEDCTFEQLLRKYDVKDQLDSIVYAIPKLTIMIPDWSWLGSFNVNSWDTDNSDISVGFKAEDRTIPLYDNGEWYYSLSVGEMPDFPVMFIKNNERMKTVGTVTRGGENSYEFVDDAFCNNDISTKGIDWQYYYSDTLYTYEEPNDNVTASELDSKVIAAYDEFGDEDYYYQRDYIYYGMTRDKSTGVYNPRFKEYLYKIRFDNALTSGLTESGDGSFPDEYSNKGSRKDDDELRELDFRIDGNLDRRFNIIVGNKSDSLTTYTFAKSVRMEDLFEYNRIHIGMRHKTALVRRR